MQNTLITLMATPTVESLVSGLLLSIGLPTTVELLTLVFACTIRKMQI